MFYISPQIELFFTVYQNTAFIKTLVAQLCAMRNRKKCVLQSELILRFFPTTPKLSVNRVLEASVNRALGVGVNRALGHRVDRT